MGVMDMVRAVSRWTGVIGLGVLFVVGGLGAGVSGPSALGQGKTMLVMPPAPLLPQHFGGWQMEGSASADAASAASAGAAGDEAAILKEYGLARTSAATYSSAGGAKGAGRVEVKALEFGDATGAAGAFTYLEKAGMRAPGAGRRLGSGAAVGDKEVLFWVGDTVVEANAAAGRAAEMAELTELAGAMPKIGGPKGAAPLLPTMAPAKGLEPGSLKYALGPAGYAAMGGVLPAEMLGWDKSAEAATASYAVTGGRRGVLTLLLYPTPQIAGDRGRAITAMLNELPKEQREAFGTLALRREGPLLLVATGGFSKDEATRMVEGIHLPLQLSWDKKMPPQFHAEVQKTYSLLTSIAVFCGVGMAAAVILGLFLGGGRAAIRVLQGKPAATEPEFLHLDLRGRSAPIHREEPGG